jgi:hypothetical protein
MALDLSTAHPVAPQQSPSLGGLDLSTAVPVQNGIAAPAPAPAATAGVAGFDSSLQSGLDDFGSALAHHLGNALHGTAQLVEHGVGWGADALDTTPKTLSSLITGKYRAPWNQAIQDTIKSDDAILAKREADYQAGTPDSPASYAGAAAGEVAPFMVGGVANAVKGVGDVAGNLATRGLRAASANVPGWLDWAVPRVASGAAQGAAISATAPVTDPSNYWSAKAGQVGTGVTLGSAAPLITGGASAITKGVTNAVRPFTNPSGIVSDWAQRQATAAGVTPQDLALQLSGAPQYVPGSVPTSAQAAPLPFLVQAEKTVTNNPALRGAFADRQAQNNLARLTQLEQVAGQPSTLADLTAQRGTAANAAYAKAYANGPDPSLVTPQVVDAWTALQQRPAMKQAFAASREYLQNQGITLPPGNAPTDPHIVQLADFAKKSLDSDISQAIRGGADVSGLRSARSALLDAVDQISPDYRAARRSYAAASPPITSMQAGTDILNRIAGKNLTTAAPGELTGAPMMTLPAYRSSLQSSLNGSDFPIQPDALRSLQAIQSDLQRESASNALRSAGSDTAYNLQAPGWLARQLYGADFSGGYTPKIAGGTLGALGGFVMGHGLGGVGGAAAGAAAGGKISAIANQRVMGALADALADPKAMADLLARTRPGSGPSPAMMRLGNAVRSGAIASSAPWASQPPIPMGVVSAP